MPTEIQIEFTVETLKNVVLHQQQRLKNSRNLRQQIGAALDRGEDPDHYRIAWLRASSLRVNDLMLEICKEFNAAHPEDRCSGADLCDVLNTTIHGYLK